MVYEIVFDVLETGFTLERPPSGHLIPGLIVGPVPPENNAAGYEVFASKSDEEVSEFLLSFSDFTLSLVSLVSRDATIRIQKARGYSDAQTARSIQQMKRIVAVMRR